MVEVVEVVVVADVVIVVVKVEVAVENCGVKVVP